MITFKDLADKVAKLMRDENCRFHEACREVLNDHGITENWDVYFSKIGQILGARRKLQTRTKKGVRLLPRPAGPVVSTRTLPKSGTEFSGLSPKETMQKLADSDS